MAVNLASVDCADAKAAIVAGEDDQRVLAELQRIEFRHEFAHQLIQMGDVISIQRAFANVLGIRILLVSLPAVRRSQDRFVNDRCGVINKERNVLVTSDEIHYELMQYIRAILTLRVLE